VKKIGTGPLKSTRMQEGFVITKVNGQEVKSAEELAELLKSASGQIQIEGVYPGYEGNYGYPLNLGGDAGDGE
jgi:hypothetical protein